MSDRAEQAQAELGWKWPVQQAIWHDLIAPGDNEWTTWSDAIVIAEKVAEVLAKHGYAVVKKIDVHVAVSFLVAPASNAFGQEQADALADRFREAVGQTWE